MANRLEQILGGILGMFGNDQNPRVIDKSQYMTAGQESLYGETPGTPMNATLYSPLATTYTDSDLLLNKGVMSDTKVKDMTGVTPTSSITRDSLTPMSTGMATTPYKQKTFKDGSIFDEQGNISFGGMDTNLTNTKPTLTSDMIKSYSVKGQEGEIPFEESKPGLLDKAEKSLKGFGDYLMSEKGMLTAAMSFNNLTYGNPNQQGLNTYITNRLNTIQSMEGNLNTAEALEKYKSNLTDPKDIAKMDLYIDQLKNNKINSSDALKGVFSSSGINVNVGNEKEGLYKDLNQSLVKKADEYNKLGVESRTLLDNYNRMSTLLDKYGETNLTEGNIQELRNMFGGIPFFNQMIDQTKAQTGREFQAVANQLVLAELRKNKGPQTDFDAIFAGSTLPSLGNSPEANKNLINYGKSINTRNILISELVRKVDYADIEKGRKTMSLVETLEQQAPGVMQTPTGHKFFDEWAATQEGTGLEKLVRWTNIYRKVRLKLPEIDLSVLKGLN